MSDEEMVTVPRELMEAVLFELGRFHDACLATGIQSIADEAALVVVKVQEALRRTGVEDEEDDAG